MKKYQNIKRAIAYLLFFSLVITSISISPEIHAKAAKKSSYKQVKNFRITVDGDVYQTTVYKDRKNDEIYLTPSVVNKIIGHKPTATVRINNKLYTSLRVACEEFNIESYEYDSVLNAAYIWTNLYHVFSDEDRVAYYGLGTYSDKNITYKKFFTILDKAVEIANKPALKKWKSMFKKARKSNDGMLRMEAMMAVLQAALIMGPEYSEFNYDWVLINNAIGEKQWDEVSKVCETYDPFRYFADDYPYKGGSFLNDLYIYEWNTFGVALRYGYGRISNATNSILFDYDDNKCSMRIGDKLTTTEALNAVSRLLDSVVSETNKNLLSLSENRAFNYDNSIITPELLKRASEMPKVNSSRWCGLVIGNPGYENREIDVIQFEKDARYISEWGFNSIRLMLTYQTLFDENITKVDESALKQLDKIISIAMDYRIHLNIVTFTLPGRWVLTDHSNYTSIASLDLFTNKERQKEANAIWELLAKRYKDVPSSVLSFCPLWEATNPDLSSGLEVTPYTTDDVANVYNQLITTIHEQDEDRFVIYEPTSTCPYTGLIKESEEARKLIEANQTNVQMITNYCEGPFVFAEMTAVAGEHIDFNNHSMFKPEYPVTIYSTKYHLDNNEPLTLKGDLPKGTKIDMYLSKTEGNGDLKITADGKIIYSDYLSSTDYSVGYPLSGYYPYAQSDKKPSVVLNNDVNDIEFSYSGTYMEWCGIDVILPDKYAVKRWWFPSGYDAFLEPGNDTSLSNPTQLQTSRIMISPYSFYEGSIITISNDISYTTDYIYDEASSITCDKWGNAISKFAPKTLIRCENAAFSIGCEYQSALRYYEDFLKMCEKYDFGWLMNDYTLHMYSSSKYPSAYAGAELVSYRNNDYILLEMLQLYQRYAQKPTVIS